MKITCVQFNPVWQDVAANITNLKRQFANQIAQEKPDVVVLPELFHCGFSMDTSTVVESRDGELYQALSQLAQTYAVTLIAGLALKTQEPSSITLAFEAALPRSSNVALVFDPSGNEQACYIKNYAFSMSGEHLHYQQGNQQVVFYVGDTPCSVFICYDLRFPELFRKVTKAVEVIFVIANWPESRQSHWQALLTARAIENQCFVVGVNRIGQDGYGLDYAGGSMVVNPLGDTMCKLSRACEYHQIEVDPTEVQALRARYPFLKDMKR